MKIWERLVFYQALLLFPRCKFFLRSRGQRKLWQVTQQSKIYCFFTYFAIFIYMYPYIGKWRCMGYNPPPSHSGYLAHQGLRGSGFWGNYCSCRSVTLPFPSSPALGWLGFRCGHSFPSRAWPGLFFIPGRLETRKNWGLECWQKCSDSSITAVMMTACLTAALLYLYKYVAEKK